MNGEGRYARQEMLPGMGSEGQRKLAQSCVGIMGIEDWAARPPIILREQGSGSLS